MQLEDLFGLENSSLDLPELDPYYFTYAKEQTTVVVFPSLHDQAGFSRLGSNLLGNFEFDRVIVELPQELETQLLKAIDRLPLTTIVHDGQLKTQNNLTLTPHPTHAYIVHPGEVLFWICYLARRNGIPVAFMDSWHPDAYMTWQVPLNFISLATVGWNTFWTEGHKLVTKHLTNPIHAQRSVRMAKRIQEVVAGLSGTMLIACGAAHWPAIDRGLRVQGYVPQDHIPIPEEISDQFNKLEIRGWEVEQGEWHLADIHPHTIHLVTNDFPFFLGKLVENPLQYQPLEHLRELYFEAETKYTHQFDDQVSPASYRRMFQYLRNLGRIQGKLIPDLFNLVTGAKGMVDDDYAFEVYRTAISYPFLPTKDQELEQTIKFTPDEQQGRVIRLAFKRRFRRPVLKKLDDDYDDLDPIPEEEYPGQWQEIWDRYSKYGYVSYPPEDEFIENYLAFLRKRIIEILMEEEASTLEFETSLEDGIDWRETMRHYHEGKIYVKKYPRNKFQVGALIVQFLEEPYDESKYKYHSTLFAEHDQESHISVITTTPGDVLVGPGITRVKYAAIISQFPPAGMPYLIPSDNIEIKLRLIWTAMNMSLNKIIGFVAKKPPTPAQRHFAAEQGFRLIYLPMGQLTQASLHRLRTMHLLAHRDLRDNAREYIGF